MGRRSLIAESGASGGAVAWIRVKVAWTKMLYLSASLSFGGRSSSKSLAWSQLGDFRSEEQCCNDG
jgi:hypothetical protein